MSSSFYSNVNHRYRNIQDYLLLCTLKTKARFTIYIILLRLTGILRLTNDTTPPPIGFECLTLLTVLLVQKLIKVRTDAQGTDAIMFSNTFVLYLYVFEFRCQFWIVSDN